MATAALLVAGKVVTAEGDDTLLLTHFLTTGGVILEKKGRGTALAASNTKRSAASTLGLAAKEVPALVDGSDVLVAGLAFPDHGFTRRSVGDSAPLVRAIADAYLLTSRVLAAQVLREKLEDVEKGFAACDAECLQIVQSAGGSTAGLGLSGIVGSDGKVRLRRDATGRWRVTFNLGVGVLLPEYVRVISDPAHRARQVSELLRASEDLRRHWDAAAEGGEPNVIQGSSLAFGECG